MSPCGRDEGRNVDHPKLFVSVGWEEGSSFPNPTNGVGTDVGDKEGENDGVEDEAHGGVSVAGEATVGSPVLQPHPSPILGGTLGPDHPLTSTGLPLGATEGTPGPDPRKGCAHSSTYSLLDTNGQGSPNTWFEA